MSSNPRSTPQSYTPSTSGILTTPTGHSIIPASKRADGSIRKEIKVRPGYKPTEDVAAYKSPLAALKHNQGNTGIPGADGPSPKSDDIKSKNAKRREAARRKAEADAASKGDGEGDGLGGDMAGLNVEEESRKAKWKDPTNLATNLSEAPSTSTSTPTQSTEEEEKQKKIRNLLKKLKAVRELKEKKVNGEKLSPEQLVKLGKESELMRDLEKLGHDI